MPKVESFEIDHRKLKAPYVRKCYVLSGEKGDNVTKFDLRFAQPNKEELETGTIHALEHLLAGFLREHLDGIIDISPMGCRTGFYISLWGDREAAEIKVGLEKGLAQVLTATEVPAANEIQCGNYRDLDLQGAIALAKNLLDKGLSLNIYGEE